MEASRERDEGVGSVLTQELPIVRSGVFTLFCSGPRLDGRFGLHRTSPSEAPFAFAEQIDDRWCWVTVDGEHRGDADGLEACLLAAHQR